jgi:hypothetical protein
MRHWEKTAKNCDILEVYSSHEVEQLKNIPKIRFERLMHLIIPADVGSVKAGDEAFDFGIGIAESKSAIVEDELSGTKAEKFELKEEEEIDIDDI